MNPPWPGIFELLDRHWTGLSGVIERCEVLGSSWRARSKPEWVEGPDGVVAHAGRMDVSMVVEGQPRMVAAIHAVCTDVGHRRRGLARQLMAAQVAHARAAGALPSLFAVDPRIYEGHGFVPVRHHVLRFHHDHPGRAGRLRPLDADVAGDAALVLELGETRAPTGDRFAPGPGTGWLVVMDELLARRRFDRLWLLEAEGEGPWVVAFDLPDDTLHLLDVVGPSPLPELGRVLDAIPRPFSKVRLHYGVDVPARHGFAIEQLRHARLERVDDGDVLMVAGNSPALDRDPFAVSPLAQW